MSDLKLLLLGSPQIKVDGQTVDIPRRKAVALLSYLALDDAKCRQRDTLATLFWPEYDQRRARAALRSVLWVLNRSPIGAWLRIEAETVSLQVELDPVPDGDAPWLDVIHFRQLLALDQSHVLSPEADCSDHLDRLNEAVALYRDDFMAGFTLPDAPDFDQWQFFQSESLRQCLASALDRLVKLYQAKGDYEPALPHARRRLDLDPLHEPAHRTLMQLYALAGQQAAALRQYQLCGEVLQAEFGVAPSEETIVVCESIRTGTLNQDAEAERCRGAREPSPSLPRSPASLHNLPSQPTPFIGRETELAELTALLIDPNIRLVTLIGPGGMGKTRLALEAAAGQTACYAHGVYFVRLASLHNGENVPSIVAEAVGYPLQADQRSAKQQLLDYFREKEMLLVLDNLEHLLHPVDPISETENFGPPTSCFIADLLQTAPQLKILVTSRERIKLSNETVMMLKGMELPQIGPGLSLRDGPPTPAEPKQQWTDYNAVRLFLQSARYLQPDLEATDDNLLEIIRICRLVEGIPLGIILAAAWVELLTLEEIVIELSQNLDLLETELSDVPARQRSIRAVFEHSWRLLSEPERKVFQELSVFRGGFTAMRHRLSPALHFGC